jgi:hypothetical protein
MIMTTSEWTKATRTYIVTIGRREDGTAIVERRSEEKR